MVKFGPCGIHGANYLFKEINFIPVGRSAGFKPGSAGYEAGVEDAECSFIRGCGLVGFLDL